MNTIPFRAFLRLEISDALRSRWVAFTCALYAAIAAAFIWVGLRESSVLGFTGISRALLNVANAVIVIVPLLVLVATHSAVVRARSGGFCELMLTQPVRRSSWFFAVVMSRMMVLLGPLVILFALCAVATMFTGAEDGLASIAITSLAICASLVFAFVGTGLLISVVSRSPERAVVLALLTFVFVAALHDVLLISALLRTPMPPQLVFALAALNPCELARVGILASADPELSVLGPVGFWLANSLGARAAVALAIAWPVMIGLATTAAAQRIFSRSDLII